MNPRCKSNQEEIRMVPDGCDDASAIKTSALSAAYSILGRSARVACPSNTPRHM
jgi:hypothetical protein